MTRAIFQSAVEIPGYLCEELIGRGGMGAVYRATELAHDRPVAIKLLAEGFRDDPEFVRRFEQEAQLLAGLQHPHIVPLVDSGSANGVPYIVMRLIDGPNLRDLAHFARPSPAEALRLLSGVAAAIDFAHRNGVLHRDIKPHNILVEAGVHPWLADFGLTRLAEETVGFTATSRVTGSFDYLAPELVAGARATSASDIYSFAVTAFHLLTGRLPFERGHSAAVLHAHLSAPRPAASGVDPSLPRSIDSALADGMAVQPGARQPNAMALVDQLAVGLGQAPFTRPVPHRLPSVASLSPTPERDTSAHTHAGAPLRRRRRRLTAVVIVALAAAAAGLSLGFGAGHPAHAAGQTYREIVGGEAHNWIDYKTAVGAQGPTIPAYHAVQIACRLQGWKVQDGNVWWYRIASKPWDGRYYVSADAFYNNGQSHGSLHGTPFFDPRVRLC